MSVKTVKDLVQKLRPSVLRRIATDWFTDGYLKWCLMYSRNPKFQKRNFSRLFINPIFYGRKSTNKRKLNESISLVVMLLKCKIKMGTSKLEFSENCTFIKAIDKNRELFLFLYEGFANVFMGSYRYY